MKRHAAAFVCLLGSLMGSTFMAQADGPAPAPRDPSSGGGRVVVVPQTVPDDMPDSAPSFEPQQEFVLPSGNIGCVYTPKGGTAVYTPVDGGPELSCDRVEPVYVRATLGRRGAASLQKNPGDAGCCSGGPVLDYGAVFRAGPFSCLSERTGLNCSRTDGHGFFLSRRRIAAD